MNYQPLRYSQTCIFEDSDLIDQIISNIGKKPNKIQRLHMSSVLANMLRSQITEIPVIHATKCEYTWAGKYNPCGLRRRGVTNTLKLMVDHAFISQYTGFSFEGIRKPSNFEPTEKLLKILNGMKDWPKVRFATDQEILVQKVDGIKVGYEDSPATLAAKRVLDPYNVLLSGHEVEHPSHKQFKVSQRILRRVFVDFHEELGGRFYAPWQNMSSKDRSKLTIDGKRTIELDFKSLYPAMLWGGQGIGVFDTLEDPYAVEAVIHSDKETQRNIIKKLFMAMLGSKCSRDAINSTKKAFRKEIYLEYSALNEAVMEVKKKHMPIAHHFFKGKSFMLELQYMDSQICETILETMTDNGVLVLPVHDSFIVQAEHEAQLFEVMKMAFKKHCGEFDPVIDKKGSGKMAVVRQPKGWDALDELLGDAATQ